MFTRNQGERDLTCQNQDCVPAAASRTLERWERPNWHRSSVESSWANERRRVPLEKKVGSFLLTAEASVAAESGMTGGGGVIFKENRCDGFYGNVIFCTGSHYLLNICVQLEYLSLPFHLSHTDLTGEL